ncbi:MAG: hypothetical protein IJ923_04480 [Campylobacter sp.]|nr:hypothetical protein [Campylobacter sp.]
MKRWIEKEVRVEVEVDFDDIKDEFEDEILDFISDEIWLEKNQELLKRIFGHSTQTIATAINTIAENGSESEFNELFYSLGDTAKEKLRELLHIMRKRR